MWGVFCPVCNVTLTGPGEPGTVQCWNCGWTDKDDVAAFKKTWGAVLSRIFGWDDESIGKFITESDYVFHSAWFLHDAPLEFLPGLVLARSLVGTRDEQELRKIGEEILRAVVSDGRSVDHFYLHEDAGFDWQEARKRVDSTVAKYRAM